MFISGISRNTGPQRQPHNLSRPQKLWSTLAWGIIGISTPDKLVGWLGLSSRTKEGIICKQQGSYIPALAPKWLQCLHRSYSSPHTKNLWKWFIFCFYQFSRSVVYRFHEIRRLRKQHVYDGVTVECAWCHIFVVRNVNMPTFQLFDFLHFYM